MPPHSVVPALPTRGTLSTEHTQHCAKKARTDTCKNERCTAPANHHCTKQSHQTARIFSRNIISPSVSAHRTAALSYARRFRVPFSTSSPHAVRPHMCSEQGAALSIPQTPHLDLREATHFSKQNARRSAELPRACFAFFPAIRKSSCCGFQAPFRQWPCSPDRSDRTAW